jgi:hypothetical protein
MGECVQMPAKKARSAPRPPSGLPERTVAVRTSLLPCRKPGKPRVFTPVQVPSGESRLMSSPIPTTMLVRCGNLKNSGKQTYAIGHLSRSACDLPRRETEEVETH